MRFRFAVQLSPENRLLTMKRHIDQCVPRYMWMRHRFIVIGRFGRELGLAANESLFIVLAQQVDDTCAVGDT